MKMILKLIRFLTIMGLSLAVKAKKSWQLATLLFLMALALPGGTVWAGAMDVINREYQAIEDELDQNLARQAEQEIKEHLATHLGQDKKGYQALKGKIRSLYDHWDQEKRALYAKWHQDLQALIVKQETLKKRTFPEEREKVAEWYRQIRHYHQEQFKTQKTDKIQEVKHLWKKGQRPRGLGCGPDMPDIDLRAEGMPMAHVAPRVQQNLGNCYSQASVQLWDSFLKSHGSMPLDFHSSAYMASLLGPEVNRGRICSTLERIFQEGTCDHRETEAIMDNTLKIPLGDFDAQLDREFAKRYQSQGKLWKKLFVSSSKIQKKTKDYSEKVCQDFKKAGLDLQWDITSERILGILQMQLKNANDFKRSLLICPEKFRHPGREGLSCKTAGRKFLSESEDARFLQIINDNLNRETPRAVGITICHALILQGKSYAGLSKNPLDTMSLGKDRMDDGNGPMVSPFVFRKKDCGLHNVVISGRRSKDGQCQYKITNSWGTSCEDPYHPDWKENCQNGEIWIDAQDLLRNTMDAHWIEERK